MANGMTIFSYRSFKCQVANWHVVELRIEYEYVLARGLQ